MNEKYVKWMTTMTTMLLSLLPTFRKHTQRVSEIKRILKFEYEGAKLCSFR